MSPSLSRGFVGRLARAVLLPLTALCASASASAAVDPSELLPVDQVFVLSADAPVRDRITLHWTIADGYYLYRHRIGVQSSTPDFAGYPPQVRTLTVALPSAAPSPQADAAADSGFGALARSLAGGNAPSIGLQGG